MPLLLLLLLGLAASTPSYKLAWCLATSQKGMMFASYTNTNFTILHKCKDREEMFSEFWTGNSKLPENRGGENRGEDVLRFW